MKYKKSKILALSLILSQIFSCYGSNLKVPETFYQNLDISNPILIFLVKTSGEDIFKNAEDAIQILDCKADGKRPSGKAIKEYFKLSEKIKTFNGYYVYKFNVREPFLFFLPIKDGAKNEAVDFCYIPPNTKRLEIDYAYVEKTNVVYRTIIDIDETYNSYQNNENSKREKRRAKNNLNKSNKIDD